MSRLLVAAAVVVLAVVSASSAFAAPPVYRVSRVIDGDTIELGNGQRVRLVQIDTPEVYGGYECYGPQHPGSRSNCCRRAHGCCFSPSRERPRDQYGRLLRYVVRASDGTNVNLRLVAAGAAAPWFYEGERGRFFATLQTLAKQARVKRLGLWGACPQHGVRPVPRGHDSLLTEVDREGRIGAIR